jgi:hypothetical protein
MALKIKGSYIDATDNAVGYNVSIGTFVSAAVSTDSQNKLNSAKTKSLDVCCDDGNAALTAGTAYRPIRGRMLLVHAQSGDTSIYGIQGHLKNTAADTSSGNKAGLWGYYEAVSGATVAANSSGIFAMIDAPSGATIATGTIGALQIGSNDLGGTHTGNAVGINFTEALTGAFDAAFAFPSGSEFITASQLTGGTSQYIKVLINGVPFTVAATRAS